jgi:hypothetical protein
VIVLESVTPLASPETGLEKHPELRWAAQVGESLRFSGSAFCLPEFPLRKHHQNHNPRAGARGVRSHHNE